MIQVPLITVSQATAAMATTPTLSRRSRSTTPSGVIRAGRRLYRPASPPRTPAGTAHPARQATAATLAAAGIDDRPEALLADSGYRSIANLTEIEGTPELLIPPARHGRQGKTRYAKRRETVEPMFGQIKEQQDARRFLRRGRRACRAEWKLLCGTHNLLKAL